MQLYDPTSSTPSGQCLDYFTPRPATPRTPKSASNAEQKMVIPRSSAWDRRFGGNQIEVVQQSTPAEPSTPRIGPDCCALQRLNDMLRYSSSKKRTSSQKDPGARLADWVSVDRNEDDNLSEDIKETCPLEKCTFRCNPADGELVKHILNCPFLRYGKYRCPYHNNEIEEFMPLQRRRTLKSWSREHHLRDAFRDVCKLGSKGLLRAFSHSKKRTAESENAHSNNHDHRRLKIASNHSTFLTEKLPRRSTALQSQVFTLPPEIDGNPTMIAQSTTAVADLQSKVHYELSGDLHSNVPFRGPMVANPQALPELMTDFDGSDDASDTVSPESANQYVSLDRFLSPPSPEEVIRWSSAVESSSEQESCLAAKAFDYPMKSRVQGQQQSPSSPPSSAINKHLNNKGKHNLSIDTRVGSGKPIAQNWALSRSIQSPSTPSNPQILRLDPHELCQGLQSVFGNTYTVKYAQLSTAPRLPIIQEIMDARLGRMDVFLAGWEAVKMVLQGRLPQKLGHLLCLAHLAHSCGQFVWESRWRDQNRDIAEDLNVWSYALRSPKERQQYQEVMEQIYINKEDWSSREEDHDGGCSSASPPGSPSSTSSTSSQHTLSIDGPGLVRKLRYGAVIRSCLQYLRTSEFCQNRSARTKANSINIRTSLLSMNDAAERNIDILDSTVIRPLLADEQFRVLHPIIKKAADLLYEFPYTTTRELETFLVCHARYCSPDYILHFRFHLATTAACSLAARQLLLLPALTEDEYHLQSIALVCQYQPALPNNIHSHVQELQGSPVTTSIATSFSPVQPAHVHSRFSQASKCYTPSQTPVSASMSTPSTATSNGAPYIFTPVSANTSSPATATEPPSAYQSHSMYNPYKAITYPTITAGGSHSSFGNDPMLPLANGYDFSDHNSLPAVPPFDNNSFAPPDSSNMATESFETTAAEEEYVVPADISLFNTEVPTNSSLPAGDEAKASLACPHGDFVHTGERKWLKSNLNRHIREVHGPKANALVCGFCQKRFTRKGNLKVHLDTVHGKERSNVIVQDPAQTTEDNVWNPAGVMLGPGDSIHTVCNMEW